MIDDRAGAMWIRQTEFERHPAKRASSRVSPRRWGERPRKRPRRNTALQGVPQSSLLDSPGTTSC